MASTANQLRLQARRVSAAARKAQAGLLHRHRNPRPKVFKGPAPRKLRIRA